MDTLASSSTGTTQSSTVDTKHRFWRLTLAAIGVVYGDIGTSPLYAFRESIAHIVHQNGAATAAEIVGVISLMLWALIAIVTLKYATILLRLDNRGEGGTLSLMALVQRAHKRTPFVLLIGLAGAGLFYGDAMLTPAISVLSAIEGLTVLPALTGRIEAFVLPLTLSILVFLFFMQRRGSGFVGAWFGPICIVWFATLAFLGLMHLGRDWTVLAAFNPLHAVTFLTTHAGLGFVVLGSVFLTVTGAEALYADMGHFGRKPIARAWIWLVFPALAINYLGQGAMVIVDPSTIGNPFFLMAPEAWRPVVLLIATAATIIASQAVISGTYSLTQQAIQLGLLPRMRIMQTSERHFGQIYMPQVNYLLMAGVLLVTFWFRSSSALGSAYGVSVIGAMITSSLLAIVAIWKVSKRPLWFAIALMTPFLIIEAVFAGANLLKLFSGGIVPLLIAACFVVIMWTWVRGSALLHEQTRRDVSLKQLLATLEISPPKRVRGTAIFLTADPHAAPAALLHNLKHNQVLHERIIMLCIRTAPTPRAVEAERVMIETVRPDIFILTLSFGFMETPNVIRGLTRARERGLHFDIMTTSFFLSRRALVPTAKSTMPHWQDRLFIFLARNAANATEFFHIPSSRVVELGAQVAV